MTEITGNENAMSFLTIRQEFAARFMAASLSNPEAMEYLSKSFDYDSDAPFERIAQKSLELADCLISALNKPKK